MSSWNLLQYKARIIRRVCLLASGWRRFRASIMFANSPAHEITMGWTVSHYIRRWGLRVAYDIASSRLAHGCFTGLIGRRPSVSATSQQRSARQKRDNRQMVLYQEGYQAALSHDTHDAYQGASTGYLITKLRSLSRSTVAMLTWWQNSSVDKEMIWVANLEVMGDHSSTELSLKPGGRLSILAMQI